MSCEKITKGKNTLSCRNNVGGLKNIYFANDGEYDFTATSPVGSTSSITFTITDLGTLDEVFQYRLKNSGNTFQEDITVSEDNGTVMYSQVLNVTLVKVNEDMDLQAYKMATSNPKIFVETNSGKVFLLGKENGCILSGNSQVQGTLDAINGYQLTFTSNERYPKHFLDSAAVTALKALVSEENITD